MQKLAKKITVVLILVLMLGLLTACIPDFSSLGVKGANGADGIDGRSAYQIAVDNGFVGTEKQWLESLMNGPSAYEVAVKNGYSGTEAEWLESLKGKDAVSPTIEEIYAAYLANGGALSFADFLKEYLASWGYDQVEYAAQLALRSAVSIVCEFSNGSAAAGSGVIVEYDKANGNALILTNYHVAYTGTSRARTVRIAPYGYRAGTDIGIEARVLGGSPDYDIAVIEVTGSDELKSSTVIRKADLADSDGITVGEKVLAAGNPFGAGLAVTAGIVSQDSEIIEMDALVAGGAKTHRTIRIDTAINSGNSGGGLFNLDGKLVGIINAKRIGEDVEGAGSAIPMNIAYGVYVNIMANGYEFTPKKIGIEYKISNTSVILDAGKLVIVETIEVTSGKGVIDTGDILLSAKLVRNASTVAEKAIIRSFQLPDLLLQARTGDRLEVTVRRGSEIKVVSMTVV